jgi:hypothetical protein
MSHHTRAILLFGCAWVLWKQYPPDATWRVVAAHPTRESCEEEASIERGVLMDVLQWPQWKWPAIPLCLPDTLDPRRPKR